MDLFPDFHELGIWGYIVPAILLLGVFVPVWHLVGRTSSPACGSRFLTTAFVSVLALFALAVILFVIGLVVL